jgi:hypothetical protein
LKFSPGSFMEVRRAFNNSLTLMSCRGSYCWEAALRKFCSETARPRRHLSPYGIRDSPHSNPILFANSIYQSIVTSRYRGTNSSSIGNTGRSEYLSLRFSKSVTADSIELRTTICCPKTVRCRMSPGSVLLLVLSRAHSGMLTVILLSHFDVG